MQKTNRREEKKNRENPVCIMERAKNKKSMLVNP